MGAPCWCVFSSAYDWTHQKLQSFLLFTSSLSPFDPFSLYVMDGCIFASISTTLAKYESKRVFPIKLALKFALHTVWTHSLGMTTKLKKTTNQLELTVNSYFTLKNRLMGLPSFLLVHMWVGLNSADLRDRRQTRSRNSGAYSPPQCSQWFVIWPFNICCKLTDLCTVKRKKRDICRMLCSALWLPKQIFFFSPWQFTVSEEEILGNAVDLLF